MLPRVFSIWSRFLPTGIIRSLLVYYGNPFRYGRMLRFYRQFMQPGDLCFDIGAHVGNRLLIWSWLGARMVAVEPQPHLMRLLRRWYGRSSQIELLPKAVGATPGQATLYVSRRTPTVTTLSRQWIAAVQQDASFAGVEWDTAVPVDVVTLDQLIDQYGQPAFCKIDVEGYELEALRGLSRPLCALSFEHIPAAKEIAIGCIERLEQLAAYKYNWSPGESHRLQLPQWIGPDKMVQRLQKMGRNGRSGDVYARRIKE